MIFSLPMIFHQFHTLEHIPSRSKIVGGPEVLVDWNLEDKSSLHRSQLAEISKSKNTDSSKWFVVLFQLLESEIQQVEKVTLYH